MNYTTDEKPRKVVYAFSIYMSLMLFQTTYMDMGRIAAFSTIILIVIIGNKEIEKYGKVNKQNNIAFIFFMYSLFITSTYLYVPPNYLRYIAQFILYFFLSKFDISAKEFNLIKHTLYGSMCLYSFLIIRYTLLDPLSLLHGDIYLFGTALDPNYVGIPIVAVAILAMNDVLESKMRLKLLYGIVFFICVSCIVCTASRGSMLSLAIGGGLVLINFFRRRHLSFSRMIFMLLAILSLFFLFSYFSKNMEAQMLRLTTVDDDVDNGRFYLWSRALTTWQDNPLFGFGLGAGYRLFNSANHNIYIELLIGTGIIGLMLFLRFLWNCTLIAKQYFEPMSYALIAVFIQVAFLDALDNRCLWCFLCWIAMIPKYSKYN